MAHSFANCVYVSILPLLLVGWSIFSRLDFQVVRIFPSLPLSLSLSTLVSRKIAGIINFYRSPIAVRRLVVRPPAHKIGLIRRRMLFLFRYK